MASNSVNNYYQKHKEEIDNLLGITEPKKICNICNCGLIALGTHESIDYCWKHMPNMKECFLITPK